MTIISFPDAKAKKEAHDVRRILETEGNLAMIAGYVEEETNHALLMRDQWISYNDEMFRQLLGAIKTVEAEVEIRQAYKAWLVTKGELLEWK